MQILKKGSKKLLNAWAFYDWANSVYSLVIASSVFPLYYQALFSSAGIEYISIFGGTIRSTPLITYTTAIAFIFISFPIVFFNVFTKFLFWSSDSSLADVTLTVISPLSSAI